MELAAALESYSCMFIEIGTIEQLLSGSGSSADSSLIACMPVGGAHDTTPD